MRGKLKFSILPANKKKSAILKGNWKLYNGIFFQLVSITFSHMENWTVSRKHFPTDHKQKAKAENLKGKSVFPALRSITLDFSFFFLFLLLLSSDNFWCSVTSESLTHTHTHTLSLPCLINILCRKDLSSYIPFLPTRKQTIFHKFSRTFHHFSFFFL